MTAYGHTRGTQRIGSCRCNRFLACKQMQKKKLDFAYDYQGRRIQKLVSTNGGTSYVAQYTNRFVYDGWNLIAELAPNSSPIRTYLWGMDLSGDMQGAGGIGGLLEISYSSSSTTNCFIAFDGSGNVASLANSVTGQISATYETGPFGEPVRATGTMAKTNPLRFSTKYQDDETEFLSFGHRYLSATEGRWLRRDPLDELGFITSQTSVGEETGTPDVNPYEVFGNNGINRIDSLGLALYAIDGTWTDATDKANPWQLSQETKEVPSRYWRGPKNGATGSDTDAIAFKVYYQIQTDFCEAKKSGKELTINLTGWSRGAMAIALVAEMINDLGFWCNECGYVHYEPVPINWVGLFDAVAMTRELGYPTAVPQNATSF